MFLTKTKIKNKWTILYTSTKQIITVSVSLLIVVK